MDEEVFYSVYKSVLDDLQSRIDSLEEPTGENLQAVLKSMTAFRETTGAIFTVKAFFVKTNAAEVLSKETAEKCMTDYNNFSKAIISSEGYMKKKLSKTAAGAVLRLYRYLPPETS